MLPHCSVAMPHVFIVQVLLAPVRHMYVSIHIIQYASSLLILIHTLPHFSHLLPLPRAHDIGIHPRQMVVDRILLHGFRSLQSQLYQYLFRDLLKTIGILQEHPYKPSTVSPRPDTLQPCTQKMPNMLTHVSDNSQRR